MHTRVGEQNVLQVQYHVGICIFVVMSYLLHRSMYYMLPSHKHCMTVTTTRFSAQDVLSVFNGNTLPSNPHARQMASILMTPLGFMY